MYMQLKKGTVQNWLKSKVQQDKIRAGSQFASLKKKKKKKNMKGSILPSVNHSGCVLIHAQSSR